jgi:hypothetical protein
MTARQDSLTDAVIEPAATLTLAEFEIALAGTRLSRDATAIAWICERGEPE